MGGGGGGCTGQRPRLALVQLLDGDGACKSLSISSHKIDRIVILTTYKT